LLCFEKNLALAFRNQGRAIQQTPNLCVLAAVGKYRKLLFSTAILAGKTKQLEQKRPALDVRRPARRLAKPARPRRARDSRSQPATRDRDPRRGDARHRAARGPAGGA
ncbi:hypothetical protein B4Q13_20830, partial [Lacticaseibacillus rhamnosus]